MKLITGFIGGSLAGLIGAVVWAGVVFITGYEIGIIAWGIGAFVGVGVLVGSIQKGGVPIGVMAALIAVAAILLGKWMWVSMVTTENDDEFMISEVADLIIEERREAGRRVDEPSPSRWDDSYQSMYATDVWAEAEQRWYSHSIDERELYRQAPALLYPQLHLRYLADDVAYERMRVETLDWPEGYDFASAWREAHYPPEIWAEAVRRWEAYPPAEQQQYMMWLAQEQKELEQGMREGYRSYLFLHSFSPFDALWGILALASAYGIAAAGRRDDESQPEELDEQPRFAIPK